MIIGIGGVMTPPYANNNIRKVNDHLHRRKKALPGGRAFYIRNQAR